MQFPGTTPFGNFGGATALTNQLTPTSLAARKQQLIAKLASGQQNRPAFAGAGSGFAGNIFNAFGASLFGNGADGNQFYGQNGVPTPAAPQGSTAGQISTGQQSGSGQQGVPSAPTTSVPPEQTTAATAMPMIFGGEGGGISGGLNPLQGFDPTWVQAIMNVLGSSAGSNAGGFKAV